MLATTEQIKNQLIPRLENKFSHSANSDSSIVGSFSAISDSLSDTFVLNTTFNSSLSYLSASILNHSLSIAENSAAIANFNVAIVGSSCPAGFKGIFFKTLT